MSTNVIFKAQCPNCMTMIRLDEKPELDSLVFCPECDETLEIVSLNPLRFEWAYDDDSDYEYGDYDFDDDAPSDYRDY